MRKPPLYAGVLSFSTSTYIVAHTFKFFDQINFQVCESPTRKGKNTEKAARRSTILQVRATTLHGYSTRRSNSKKLKNLLTAEREQRLGE